MVGLPDFEFRLYVNALQFRASDLASRSFFSFVATVRGGEDRTRDPRPTSPVLVRFHQPKARSRISPNRQRLPKDSATHNGREEAVGRVGQFTALSKN